MKIDSSLQYGFLHELTKMAFYHEVKKTDTRLVV